MQHRTGLWFTICTMFSVPIGAALGFAIGSVGSGLGLALPLGVALGLILERRAGGE